MAICIGLKPSAFRRAISALSTDVLRPLWTPAAFALAMPSAWRSRRMFVSKPCHPYNLVSKNGAGRAIAVWAGASAITTALETGARRGLLIDSLSWRAAFWVNLPLACAAI